MVLTVNEWYCITLYTSAGGRLSGLQDEQGLLFRGRTGQMFRGPRPVRGANAHGAERCIAVVQFSLLWHLILCMISQQMEATANYLLLFKKKHLLCCDGFMVFLLFFSPSWLLLLSAWAEITVFKRCTLWECLFCAVTRWILCMEVVYKENKQTSKRLIWYPRATLCWKAGHSDDPQNLQRQQGLLLACAVDSAVCCYCFWGFFTSRFCLFQGERWPENCD